MRLFQYEVTDRAGNVLQGNLQAATSDAARLALANAGYTVKNVRENGPSPLTVANQAKPRIATQPVARKVPRIEPITAATPQRISVPSSVSQPETVRTGWLGDRALFLMFTQFGNMLRSGGSLSRSLEELSTRVGSKKLLPESLREAAAKVAEGRSMCDTFEKYPYFYPPDVVGTLRAGEVGGFLPAACQEISHQREMGQKFSNVFRIFFGYFLLIVFFAPFLHAMVNGSINSIAAQDKVNGSLPIVPTFLKYLQMEMGRMILGFAVTLITCYACFMAWHSMKMRMVRHTLALYVPVLGARTRAESMNRFFFVLGEVTKAGISGYQALNLATASIVNLRMREDLMNQSWKLKENEPISLALRRSQIMSQEHINIVENGEMTGNVPGAMDAIARDCRMTYEFREKAARVVVTAFAYIVVGITTAIIMAIMYKALYSGIITTLTND